MSAWASMLAAGYAAYVALQMPALLVPVLALAAGGAALMLFDRTRRAAWCASALVVLAVLHARALPGAAPHLAIQLGLAAFVTASATLSLFTPRAVPPLPVVLALGGGLGLVLGASAGLGPALAGLAGGLLAATRPLATLAVIRGETPADRWLAWSPLTRWEGR